MKLALNHLIDEFTNNGLKTWISHITQLHDLLYTFRSPIEDVLLLSHKHKVIPC